MSECSPVADGPPRFESVRSDRTRRSPKSPRRGQRFHGAGTPLSNEPLLRGPQGYSAGTSLSRAISMRRLRCLPLSVALLAMG